MKLKPFHPTPNFVLISIIALCLLIGPSMIFTSYGASVANANSTTSIHVHVGPLPNPDVQSYGNFGQSVATGPGNIVIVGAENETAEGYTGAGSAYTFNTNVRTLNKTFTSPNAQIDGHFGQSVAISAGGKLRHAHASIVVVGAPNETVNGLIGAGRAYIFNTSTGALKKTFSSPNVQYDGEFGWSVTASGSIVVVGAPNETVNGLIEAGRAYIFNANTGTLISTITSSEPQTNGHFGQSVGMSDNDVYNTTKLVVGAPGQNVDGYFGAGHAYLFNSTTGKLITVFSSPNAQSDGNFGWSVSLTNSIIAVGAPKETSNGLKSAGNAYVFKAGNKDELLLTLTSPNAQSSGYFGWSVWLSELTVGVGAPGETSNGFVRAGNAYAFSDQTGSLLGNYTSTSQSTNGLFGLSVTVVQGPHYPGYIIIIGAPNETANGDVSSGNAYV